MTSDGNTHAVVIGRYLLHRQIARGGMATIHIARLMGDEGFSRIVAAKRLLPEFAEDQEFVEMFLDEARIASKVHHRNVVPVLDVVTTGEEVILVQEYVHGAPLHWLLRTARQAKTHVPLPVAVSIACQVLAGLQAAHDTNDEMGASLNIVHRDVSPQNMMVATDGTARLLDFGVAKATMAAHVTRDGNFKGKLAYSAPEQIRGKACQQSDVYSLAVVLWELIVGHRMHQNAQGESELVSTIMNGSLPTITEALASERELIGDKRWKQLEKLEPIIQKGLAVDLAERHASAHAMEKALTDASPPASSSEVAQWLKQLGKEFMEGRDKMIAAEEASWRKTAAPVSRRTPIPGELKAISIEADEPELPHPSALPPAPKKKGAGLVIALLGLLVVGLGALVLVMMNRGESGNPGAPKQPVIGDEGDKTGGTGDSQPNARGGGVAGTGAATGNDTDGNTGTGSGTAAGSTGTTAGTSDSAAAGNGGTTGVKADPAATAGATTTTTTTTEPKANSNNTPRVRPPVRPTTTTARPTPKQPEVKATEPKFFEKPPEVKPPEVKPPVVDPKADCNPPYYFDGAKKIFKPNCL